MAIHGDPSNLLPNVMDSYVAHAIPLHRENLFGIFYIILLASRCDVTDERTEPKPLTPVHNKLLPVLSALTLSLAYDPEMASLLLLLHLLPPPPGGPKCLRVSASDAVERFVVFHKVIMLRTFPGMCVCVFF